MKKVISAMIILILPVVLLFGCQSQADDPAPPEQTTRSVIPEDAVRSPDGKLAAASNVQMDLEDNEGQAYSIFDVQVFDVEKNQQAFTAHIVGDAFEFLWSPNSKWIAAGYSGRTWSDVSLIDTNSHTASCDISMARIMEDFQKDGEEFKFTLRDFRQDPYIKPIEWSPDSKQLLVAYACTDAEDRTQSGVFVYDVLDNALSRLTQYPPSDEYHPEVQKPDGFSW